MRKISLIALLFLFSLAGCKPEQEIPTPQSGNADFSEPVFLGGSNMAGSRNGALSRESQQTSIAAILANQFALAAETRLEIPLLPDGTGLGVNSKPWESLFQTPSHMGNRTDCEGEVSLGPVKDTFGLSVAAPYLQELTGSRYTVFACPGATISDWNSPGFGISFGSGNPNPFYARFASVPGTSTIMSDVVVQNPTFFVAWPGMQEMINVATKGMHGVSLPSAGDFRAQLDSILGALTANGAKGALATLPDIDNLPFFTTIPAFGLNLDSTKVADLNPIYAGIGLQDFFQVGDNGFVVEDPTAPSGIRQLTADEYLCLTLPLDSVKCNLLGVLFAAIPDQYSLVASELSDLRAQVAALNGVILDLAAQYDLAVADMTDYYAKVKGKIIVDGVTFSSTFASGNFFGLDGLYPTAKGAGLIANQFILAINAKYGATIPTKTVFDLDGVRFP